ncbi:MAG: hypothetical protein HY757_06440 [Nitrospirae bacterium]|nr:hypothetical protein [Nitrospirota bacterium]
MKKKATPFLAVMFVLAMIFTQGCATKMSKPSSAPQPAKVKFSEFNAVEMKHIEISPEYASSDANQKAAKKINEHLDNKMRMVFSGLNNGKEQSAGRTLLIEPYIKEIKFISGGARFWVGAMAGSSAVLMKVTFTDKATGEVIAEPEFYRDANAMGGAYSMGSTDNLMLELVAQDVANYSISNR